MSQLTATTGWRRSSFTFFYDVGFGTDDTAFGFAAETQTLTLSVSAAGTAGVAEAQIRLIKQPDPVILHGDPSWLSVDLRVFVMRPGEKKFGIEMGNDASVANSFIQQVMYALTQGNGSADGHSFDDPAVLSPDESASALYLQPTDETQTKVFNFALARVRYNGLIGAANVRAFFRLFAAQVTTSQYDYPPGEQYRRATSNPDGQPIPLPGVAVGEYVTIPFFSHPRVDTTSVSMDQQTDSALGSMMAGNVQQISANATGADVYTFFGCWLDINQPFKADGHTFNNVLPLAAKAPLDGKFTDSSNPPVPLAQAISRNLHQCLVVEIAFDPDEIPVGADTSDNDKLAQRNIAWSPVGSAQGLTTFEIRPTAANLPACQRPDELMIDWGAMPAGSRAEVYLPAVSANEILSMAARMYTSHGLERADDHTISCPAAGVTYIPIPASGGANYAGLLAVEPPASIRRGQAFDIVVRQLTNAEGTGKPPGRRSRRGQRSAAATEERTFEWRRVIGAFQLSIPVKDKSALLVPEERNLSLLRWIGEAIPRHSRWHPVFHRYLQGIASRVQAFGGDPKEILPSPSGFGRPAPSGHGGHPAPPGYDRREARTGKITGLRYDQYGDFEVNIHPSDVW